MKDLEIIEWLYNLEPESKIQKKKIERMMRIILESNSDYKLKISENTKKFLNTLILNDVLDKPSSEVRVKYEEWCKQNKVKPEAKNVFSSAVQNEFNVKSTVIKIKGKCYRVYK